ncbi:tetratricopeptide repeat protein [Aequorivita sediminis]|uniref:tetratricopeptide repeat protein n=1 Tax=Aequorivita sediminis TaxID=3073653 RepID=UPI0028ACAD54|nr:hypothetical protein [Aequorivita sp. F6058]
MREDAVSRERLFPSFIFFILFPVFIIAQSNFQQGEEHYKQENYTKAEPIFEEYLKLHPGHIKTREYLGDIAGYNKDWDTALSYYKDLVSDHESNASYHFKYGGALGMKAMTVSRLRAVTYISEIKHHLERAIELNPQHIEARWALVELYIQLPVFFGGSEKKAIDYAKELEAISIVDGYLAMGHIAEFHKKIEDAELNYKKAIKVGGSPHTYEKLINLYEKNNQPLKAIKTALISVGKHKVNHLNYRVGEISARYNLESQIGIESLSVFIANHSIRDDIPKEWAYYQLAQIYKNIGEKEIALTWINKALLVRQDFIEALKEKSLILAL